MTLANRLLSRRWLFTVPLSLILAGVHCLAQDSTPDLTDATLEQLGNIKVYTASKHMQVTKDAPASVTVISAEEIQKHGYRTLADALKATRGFFVTYDRNYSSVGVRGFARPGDFNTRILLLVDGHRLNDNVYDEAMVGTEFPIDIDRIECIEIIRGPASSLYGSNALFAVINIITRHGSDLKGLELSANAGSFNTYEGRVSYGSRLQQLEYIISGSFYGSRGHNQLFFPEFNSPETNYGIASHADDDQLGSSLATVSFKDFRFQAAYGTREKGIPTAAYDSLFNDSRTRTTDSHGYFDLRYQHTFAKSWEVLARTFYDRYTYQGTYIYSSSSNPAETSPDFDYSDGKWWGTELQLTKTIFDRNRVTVGGEYRDNFKQDQSNYQVNPYTWYLDDRRSSFVGALYLQDELTIAKTLSRNVGFRYDYYNRFDSSIDPRVAVIYRPRSQTALKFIYGEAFRAPNVYELYYSIPPNLPNPGLHPEKLRNFEWAWEQGLHKNFSISATAFHEKMNGLITTQVVPPDMVIFENMQNASSTGVETELTGQLPRGLEGNVSYSFQQTKDVRTDQFLSNSPRHLASFRLSQSFFRKRLFASIDAQYRSGMESLEYLPVSSYTVVNATLLGRNLGKRLDISASIYNLLDKKYFDPPSSATLQMPIQQDGRSFRVKLTWHSGER
jgi:iron complex outermembrane receptor protein